MISRIQIGDENGGLVLQINTSLIELFMSKESILKNLMFSDGTNQLYQIPLCQRV